MKRSAVAVVVGLAVLVFATWAMGQPREVSPDWLATRGPVVLLAVGMAGGLFLVVLGAARAIKAR